MEKWLISVKNSKNSQIFANFGCFSMLRVKKTTFPLSKIAQKDQFSGPHPYGLKQKWLQILHRTTRGLVVLGHLKKKGKFKTKISQVPIFDISVFLRGFLLRICDFRKSGKFWQLREMVLGKPLGCTLKICNHLPAWLCLKRTIKGLFLKFRWEICLTLWFFVPRFSNKAIFGTKGTQKSIKMSWIP